MRWPGVHLTVRSRCGEPQFVPLQSRRTGVPLPLSARLSRWRRVKKKRADERDRIDAADGIVEAARLQIRGVRQDPELFKALITLLADQNEELRTMANNTLAPIRDPAFRGDLDRPERKEPNGGWDTVG